MKIHLKQNQTDTNTKVIYIETSYICEFKINNTKSGYLLTINKTNERNKLC